MAKGFEIVRSLVFVLIFAVVLAFVPFQVYKGDIITSLFLSVGMFVSSVIVAFIILFMVKRD